MTSQTLLARVAKIYAEESSVSLPFLLSLELKDRKLRTLVLSQVVIEAFGELGGQIYEAQSFKDCFLSLRVIQLVRKKRRCTRGYVILYIQLCSLSLN